MKYLVELVFGIGFFGLSAIALTFFLRFLLLTWAVRLVSHVVQSILLFMKRLSHALIFIFGPAVLGGFIIGLVLQFGVSLATSNGNSSADPTIPVLLAFLGFFVIVAVRAWQWSVHRGSNTTGLQEAGARKDSPAEYGMLADAWARAIKLAPRRRDDLLNAQAACTALLAAAETNDSLPDSAMIETGALIRNHLAALIGSTERRLHGALPTEKEAIVAEMVKLLLGFGQRARRDIQAAAPNVDEEDTAMRAHLATQLFR